MRVLGLDTASDACSVALWADGAIFEDHQVVPRQHAELVLAMVDGVLGAARQRLLDLDAIAFGAGPGSFTGLRIAAGVTQGLAFGAALPVVPISTLAALALGVWREHRAERVLAGFDARMGEVYWGSYRMQDLPAGSQMPLDLRYPVGEDRLSLPSDVHVGPQPQPWIGVGSAFATYGEQLRANLGERLAECLPAGLPRARDVAALGAIEYARHGGLAPDQAVPVYLRDQVTQPPGPQRGARG